MHLHFERIEKPNSYSDCNILSLSWMGKVPDGLLQSHDEEGWKLNRINYYQDGWIALGNSRGIVGVTYTSCRCRKTDPSELPSRTNYNLRGHRSEVTLVKWNEPYQKLASCDSSGIIFVWIKYEGRWSVELINDRNIQVTDFSWSHDGRMALICYVDGFVLIGSVAGQRYWSSMLNLDSCSTTCGIWTPDDQQVIFGTSNGTILVIDINGTIVSQLSIRDGHSIVSMAWSCEKFKMEDIEDENNSCSPSNTANKSYVLGICFEDGQIYLLQSYDDVFPIIIRTNLHSIKMEWSNKGEILAVGGHQLLKPMKLNVSYPQQSTTFSSPQYINQIHFYSESGCLRYKVTLDYTSHPICSLTWGHNDKRLFVGTGPVLHISWVTKRIASLQLLCRLAVHKRLLREQDVNQLQVPNSLKNLVASLFGRTLRCYLPDSRSLTKFVFDPPTGNVRLYCTLIRHDGDHLSSESSSSYVLYLEYLGGLVPILKGKRTSKFRPEFVIFDPQVKVNQSYDEKSANEIFSGKKRGSFSSPSSLYYWHSSSTPGTSESESEDCMGQANLQAKSRRRRRQHRSRRNRDHEGNNEGNNINGQVIGSFKPESTYTDEMPENEKLTLVTSNIWGTKFKILGLVPWLPAYLGSIAYRTSLLHLQPRQMTLKINELGEPRDITGLELTSSNCDRSGFTSSEDEDESGGNADINQFDDNYSIPIAPITPKKTIRYHHYSSNSNSSAIFSPERLAVSSPSSFFANTGQCYGLSHLASDPNHDILNSNGQEYINMISHLSEDLLTLQLNTNEPCSTVVSLEISNAPSGLNSAGNLAQSSNYASSSRAATSTSISTQTSFQSLSDLANNNEEIKIRSNQKFSLEDASPENMAHHQIPESSKTSSVGENRIEERFEIMGDKFASEFPCTSKTITCQPLALNRHEIVTPHTLNCEKRWHDCTYPSQNHFGRNSSASHRNSFSTKSAREKRDGIRRSTTTRYEDRNPAKYVSSSVNDSNCLKCSAVGFRCPINKLTSPPHRNHHSPPHYLSSSAKIVSSNLPFQSSESCTNVTSTSTNDSINVSSLISSTANNVIGVGLSGAVEGCVFETSRFPLPTSSTQHEIKFIDDFDGDETSEPCSLPYSVGRSPSFLFYRTRSRSSIAQYNHNLQHNHSLSPNIHHPFHSNINSSYSSANDFTNVRANIESNPLVNHASQRRYTLSTGKIEQSNSHSSQDDAHSDSNGQHTLTKTGKEKHRNCMSLDEDGDESEESIKGIPSSATFCKCNQEVSGVKKDDQSNEDSKFRKNDSGNFSIDSNVVIEKEAKDHTESSCDSNQSAMPSSPIHRSRRILLSFDSEELLNSLNEGNNLIRESSLLLGRALRNGSVVTRSASRTIADGISSQHRGSLTQALIGSEAGNLSKNFRNDLTNRSLPASPLTERKSGRKAQGKSIFYSPTMFRKVMKQKLNYLDCSSDDSSDDDYWSSDFMSLGSFQRSKIKKRIKVKRRSSRVQPDENSATTQRLHEGKEFILHNKAPLWNEVNQVYQLDFGGRVTQESAKNFQIEHQGKQVMQFGRIDDNAYTLDFQYPFCALQALAVALANVTQRLK